MVKFYLDYKTDSKAAYKYYPEGNCESKPGIISVEFDSMACTIVEVAEEDFICVATAKSLNEMRDSINEMRVEMGEPPFTEDELPTATEDEEWYYYAGHAIDRIKDELKKENIPDKGTVAWY